jgi:hypothetical protein
MGKELMMSAKDGMSCCHGVQEYSACIGCASTGGIPNSVEGLSWCTGIIMPPDVALAGDATHGSVLAVGQSP